ncbi:MAG: MFS transporter [Enterobacteriaceae bacterium]
MTKTYLTWAERSVPQPLKKRVIAAITIGNALEFYDFIVYSMLANVMGRLFFPADDAFVSMLVSLAVFGVGFVFRPLGGVIIGIYADRYGRRSALRLTLWLMALGSGLLVVAPTYAQVGLPGPLIVLLARIIQGFAVGGQVGAATTLLMEYADDHSRGYYCSWQMVSQFMGLLAGTLVVAVLTLLLSEQAMESWGWRLIFAISVLTIPVGEYIRHKLTETAAKPTLAGQQESASRVERRLYRKYLREILAGILLVIGGTAPAFIVVPYMANYAVLVYGMPLSSAIWASCSASVIQMMLSLHAGRLGDRFGRKPMMLYPRLLLLMMIYPAFWLLQQHHSLTMLIAVVSVLSVVLVYGLAPGIAVLPELFPRRIRASAMSIVYCVGVMIFGGFAQFIVTGLIKLTGDPLSPAYYVIICLLLSLMGLRMIKETAGQPMD